MDNNDRRIDREGLKHGIMLVIDYLINHSEPDDVTFRISIEHRVKNSAEDAPLIVEGDPMYKHLLQEFLDSQNLGYEIYPHKEEAEVNENPDMKEPEESNDSETESASSDEDLTGENEQPDAEYAFGSRLENPKKLMEYMMGGNKMSKKKLTKKTYDLVHDMAKLQHLIGASILDMNKRIGAVERQLPQMDENIEKTMESMIDHLKTLDNDIKDTNNKLVHIMYENNQVLNRKLDAIMQHFNMSNIPLTLTNAFKDEGPDLDDDDDDEDDDEDLTGIAHFISFDENENGPSNIKPEEDTTKSNEANHHQSEMTMEDYFNLTFGGYGAAKQTKEGETDKNPANQNIHIDTDEDDFDK